MIAITVATRLARSSLALDWLPVVVVPPVLVLDAALSASGKPIGVVNVLAAFVGCLPLVLRRRLPFIKIAPLIVAGVVLVLWLLHPGNTVVLIPMICLFELALSGDRRHSLQISLAVVPCVVVSVLPFTHGWPHLASIIIRNLALCLLAIAAGEVLRSRRLSTMRLLATREHETLRRVSDERLRIAREIHDVVAHAMTAINVQAGVAAHLLEREPGQAYDALRDIKRTSGEALTELRATLDVLRDPDGGPAPTTPGASLHDLDALTGGLRTAGVRVDLDVDLDGTPARTAAAELPEAVHRAGYRIVQEALTNVARHAEAHAARVTVRRLDGALTIEVVNDGRGGGVPDPPEGNGVRGMRERAGALGGSLESAPRPGGGWQVRARLPVAP